MQQEYIKYVNGNIVAESGNHFAVDWGAGWSIPDNWCGDIIEGNLILSDTNTVEPYYEYRAIGDVVAGGCTGESGSIAVVYPSAEIINLFKSDLEDIVGLLDILPSDDKQCNLACKMCYLNAVSAYEYFMSSFLVGKRSLLRLAL